MKITEVTRQKNNPSRVSVFSDGEYLLSLDEVDAVTLGIKPGIEIDEKKLNNLLFESQFGKAKSKAVEIISAKSVSAHMLSEMLTKKGYDEIVVNEVIEEFTSLGYIDDENFARLYIEYAIEKLWGEKKIVYELSQKGVDRNTIEDVLCEFTLPDECVLAEHIYQKYRGEDFTDPKVKAKALRYLASRGFDFSVAKSAVEKQKKD